MFDIDFFKNSSKIKKGIVNGGINLNASELFITLDALRNKNPYVFNIETTNTCNMKCVMCPRTSLMKRKIEHMEIGLFEKILKQITPHQENNLGIFWKYITGEYAIDQKDRSENAFYFFTISKSLTLHGYGEPLLDPYINERVALCSKFKVPTYFSCVPANIDVEKLKKIMLSGLGTIKFSMDALDDSTQKKIRGEKSDFTQSFKKIMKLVDFKEKNKNITTNIVIAMLELSKNEEDAQMYRRFIELWKDKPVYAYIKSQDNRWLYEEDKNLEYKPHYASQYCEFPWTSLTVMVDGSVVACTQDYNCEMVFGNANTETLQQIWNGEKYANFRKWHITGEFPKGNKCISRCDLKHVFDRLKENSHV